MIHFAGGRQSGAILYNAFGVMGNSDTGGQTGMSKSNGSTGSQTGSGYSTDMSDDNLPHDVVSPVSDVNEHSDSDEQVIYLQMFVVKTSFVKMYLIAVLGTASELFKSEHLAAIWSTRQSFVESQKSGKFWENSYM